MTDTFETLKQIKPINRNPVIRQTKVDYKEFPADQGLYCLFLENYKVIENQPFVIERVPENTDKATADKKNYYCIDVKQTPNKAIKQKIKIDDFKVMRGFVVQNPRQTVFFSANKAQGYLMLTKPKGQKTLQLRPFLCGSIIKKKLEDNIIKEDAVEGKQIDDLMNKQMRNKGKLPMELYKQKAGTLKATRQKKEESEFYQDQDDVTDRKENQKLKQKKKQNKEDYEEGNIDEYDLLDRDALNQEEEA